MHKYEKVRSCWKIEWERAREKESPKIHQDTECDTVAKNLLFFLGFMAPSTVYKFEWNICSTRWKTDVKLLFLIQKSVWL